MGWGCTIRDDAFPVGRSIDRSNKKKECRFFVCLLCGSLLCAFCFCVGRSKSKGSLSHRLGARFRLRSASASASGNANASVGRVRFRTEANGKAHARPALLSSLASHSLDRDACVVVVGLAASTRLAEISTLKSTTTIHRSKQAKPQQDRARGRQARATRQTGARAAAAAAAAASREEKSRISSSSTSFVQPVSPTVPLPPPSPSLSHPPTSHPIFNQTSAPPRRPGGHPLDPRPALLGGLRLHCPQVSLPPRALARDGHDQGDWVISVLIERGEGRRTGRRGWWRFGLVCFFFRGKRKRGGTGGFVWCPRLTDWLTVRSTIHPTPLHSLPTIEIRGQLFVLSVLLSCTMRCLSFVAIGSLNVQSISLHDGGGGDAQPRPPEQQPSMDAGPEDPDTQFYEKVKEGMEREEGKGREKNGVCVFCWGVCGWGGFGVRGSVGWPWSCRSCPCLPTHPSNQMMIQTTTRPARSPKAQTTTTPSPPPPPQKKQQQTGGPGPLRPAGLHDHLGLRAAGPGVGGGLHPVALPLALG